MPRHSESFTFLQIFILHFIVSAIIGAFQAMVMGCLSILSENELNEDEELQAEANTYSSAPDISMAGAENFMDFFTVSAAKREAGKDFQSHSPAGYSPGPACGRG